MRTPVISISIAGFDANELAGVLDSRLGARCRAGLHCAPLAHAHLGTLDDGGTMRIAPGPETTVDQRDAVLALLGELAATTR